MTKKIRFLFTLAIFILVLQVSLIISGIGIWGFDSRIRKRGKNMNTDGNIINSRAVLAFLVNVSLANSKVNLCFDERHFLEVRMFWKWGYILLEWMNKTPWLYD